MLLHCRWCRGYYALRGEPPTTRSHVADLLPWAVYLRAWFLLTCWSNVTGVNGEGRSNVSDIMCNLDVTVFKLLHLLPDDRSETSVWPGWCESLMILDAFVRQQILYIHLMVERSVAVMDRAMFTSLLRSWALELPKPGRDSTSQYSLYCNL